MPPAELPSRLILVGSNVGKSLSPTFQRAALAAAKIPATYDAVDVPEDRLTAVIEDIRRERLSGNVTRPHKRSFHDACDVLTSIARRVGAVNTFWMDNGQLHGDNTDVGGFDLAAREVLQGGVNGLRVLVLGAGGAAAAALAAIERWPDAVVTVVARNSSNAARLAERYSGIATAETTADEPAQSAGLIVNATPVGQHDDLHPLPVELVRQKTVVMDLVYRRGETPWVRALRRRGNVARDGMTMLVEQGALSFRQWFGQEPDRKAMREALE